MDRCKFLSFWFHPQDLYEGGLQDYWLRSLRLCLCSLFISVLPQLRIMKKPVGEATSPNLLKARQVSLSLATKPQRIL